MNEEATRKHQNVRPLILDGFHQFARNGQWGTCVDCPQADGKHFPEFCVNYARGDHWLTLDQLVHQYKTEFTR